MPAVLTMQIFGTGLFFLVDHQIQYLYQWQPTRIVLRWEKSLRKVIEPGLIREQSCIVSGMTR